MREMFFGEAPPFDQIIADPKEFEDRVTDTAPTKSRDIGVIESSFQGCVAKRNGGWSVSVERMRESQPILFRGRHFRSEVIVLCVRWYLRYPLSYRDLEEMMLERGLSVDHSTIARWVLHYAPILNRRIRREMRHPNRSWRVDETYVRVAGKWT
jgi:hypothetical protein